jgi:hypothetical protein
LKGRSLAPTARLIPAQGIALGKIPHTSQRGLKARSIAFSAAFLAWSLANNLEYGALQATEEFFPRRSRLFSKPHEPGQAPEIKLPIRSPEA